MASDSIDLLTVTLAADVAAGGAITFGYPSGRSASDYQTGDASLGILGTQNVLKLSSGKFSVALGANPVVTYVAGPTIKAGTRVALELPRKNASAPNLVVLTAAAYAALADKDENTLYAVI